MLKVIVFFISFICWAWEDYQSSMRKGEAGKLPGRTGWLPKDWLNRGSARPRVRLKQ